MQSGVYTITNTVNRKVYVGSAVHFGRRWSQHISMLRSGTHHSRHLQSAFTKHGETAFMFAPILSCAPEHVVMYEQILIDGMRAADRAHGYNAAPTAGSQLGHKHSDAARAKIRSKRATQVFSEEQRHAIGLRMRKQKLSPSHIEALRKSRLGMGHTDATKALMSAAKRGKPTGRLPSNAKLTNAKVAEIRARCAVGESHKSISVHFGIDQSSVSLINNFKRWPKPRKELL